MIRNPWALDLRTMLNNKTQRTQPISPKTNFDFVIHISFNGCFRNKFRTNFAS